MIDDVWWATSCLVMGTELNYLAGSSVLGRRKDWRKVRSVVLCILRVHWEGRRGPKGIWRCVAGIKAGCGNRWIWKLATFRHVEWVSCLMGASISLSVKWVSRLCYVFLCVYSGLHACV